MKISHTVTVLLFSFLFIFDHILCGSIQSWDIETQENYYGIPNGFKLHFNLESGLSSSEYIQINLPDSITIQSSDLYLFENTLLLVPGIVCVNYPANIKTYYCQYGITLKQDTWYTINLQVDSTTVNWSTAVTEPVEMLTISDSCNSIINCSPIIYDMNNYFGYLLRTPTPVTLQTLIIRMSYSIPTNQQLIPGQIYYAYLDITPKTNYLKGATYIISISPTSPLIDADFNFKFGETCFSDVLNCQSSSSPSCVSIPQIQKSKCQISKQSDSLTFQVKKSLNINQTFRIKVQVVNPLTVLTANIRVQGISSDSSRTSENGQFVNALQTNIINIYKGRFLFMWGMSQYELSLQNDVPYTLFKSGTKLPTVNSVFISFKVSQSLPLGKEYYVEVSLGLAAGIVENSIVTNLPRLDLGKQPKCYQRKDPATNICYVACQSVGALIYQDYEYFIGVKVQYTFASLNLGASQTQVSSYGQVNIQIMNKPLVPLYQSYFGETIQIYANTEYFDSNGISGFNEDFGLGTSQIISFSDSKKKSAVPDGVENFLSSTNKNTVGITPLDVADQQLLFFLKVTQNQFDTASQIPIIAGSGVNFISRMSVMYNPKSVIYEQGYDNMGLDMASFQLATMTDPDLWNIDSVPCYLANKCSWYNQTSISGANNYLQKSPSSATIPYNIHRFECITDYIDGCDNWKGYKKANGYSGVFSMRRIKFRTGFHSQLQGDDNLLDFVIAFHLSGYTAGVNPVYTLQTVQLINAYTIQSSRLLTSKISFVNFSEKAVNPGHRFPTFLRIGGSISKSEHLQATAIAVFFDDSLQLNAFYNQYNPTSQAKKDIGCSFPNCYFYQSNSIFGYETWMSSNMVVATGFVDIENEFNLLIPVQNKLDITNNVIFPKRLVIAFCDFSNTSYGVENQLRILSVYRVYGAPTKGDIASKILPIYTLSALTPLDLTVDQWASSLSNQSIFDLQMNNVQPQGITDTQFKAESSVKINHNLNYAFGLYGAGFTFSSLNYNVFAPSVLSMINAPYGVVKNCTKFSYTFNDLQFPLYADYNKFKIYNVFCPVDAFLSDVGSISWINPFFNYQFSSALKLLPILRYSFSSGIGQIYSFYSESQSVNPLNFNSCVINQVMRDLHPNSVGKQAIDLSFQIKGKIPFDVTGQTGYGFMRVKVAFNMVLIGLIQYSPACSISNYLATYFVCTIYSFQTDQWHILFTPISTYLLDLLENINFKLYVDASGMSANSSIKYDINVYLPTEKVLGSIRVFGKFQSTPFPNNFILFSKCTNAQFNMASSAYLQVMNLNNLQFEVKNSLSKSPFNFTFATTSPRERFYYSSFIQFDFGFLIAPYTNPTLMRAQNIRCSVYEAPVSASIITSDQFVLSWKWKYISYLNNLRDVRLYPKVEFSDPNLYVFALKCVGGYTADNSQQILNIQSKWLDDISSTVIQQTITSSAIAFPTSTDVIDTTALITTTSSLYSKLFNMQGFEAEYIFTIQTSLSLNYYSRIYIAFPQFVGVGMNRELSPECYTKINNLSSTTITSDIKLAYCEIIGDNRISIWMNQLVLTPNTPFHLYIFGIAQPELTNKSNLNKEIWIGIDDDALLSNGIKSQQIISDIPSPLTSASSFSITSLTISNYYIRQFQDITIAFDVTPTQITQSLPLYLQFTTNFANIYMGDILTCSLIQYQIPPNFITLPAPYCQFISQRIIKITLASNPSTYFKYSLKISNIPTPFYVPDSVKNQLRVYLFEAQDALGPPITSNIKRISLHYYSNYYSFIRDTTKIDLLWYIYNSDKSVDPTNNNMIVQTDSLETQRTVFVNIGYFKRLIRLQPENNQNYLLSLGITLSGQTSLFQFIPTTLQSVRGQQYIEFKMGAMMTAPTGIYQLSAQKVGDDNKVYDTIPNLKVIVSGEACQVQARQNYYQIPIGGISLPIEIDFFNCMPLDDIIFTPLLTNAYSNELQFDPNYMVNKISGTSQDSRMYYVINEKTNNPTKVNQSVLLTFKVSGTNQYSFLPPDQINLKYVLQSNIIYPTATPISNVQVDQNKAQFSISCDQPGIVYWVIGIDPSVTPIVFNDILNKVTGAKGLLPEAVESLNNTKQKVYGFDVSYSNKPIIKTFDNLIANAYYSFKYYCYNQMKLNSSFQMVSWKIPDNGAYILKIVIYFENYISYKQQEQLSCSIKAFFALPQQRVVSDQNTRCDEYPNYINLNLDNLNVKNYLNSFFPYMFYILPDHTVKQDSTNSEIKDQIGENQFITNFMITVPNSSAYPTINQIEAIDIFSSDLPEIAVISQIQVYSTIALAYLKIRNSNGYFLVGLEEGKSNIYPTPDQIKKGLNYYNKNLVTFEMRYSEREVNQEFKFIQLKPGTMYTSYFIGSTDDPSSSAIVTQPIIMSFQTSGQSYSVQNISGCILREIIGIIFIFIVLL